MSKKIVVREELIEMNGEVIGKRIVTEHKRVSRALIIDTAVKILGIALICIGFLQYTHNVKESDRESARQYLADSLATAHYHEQLHLQHQRDSIADSERHTEARRYNELMDFRNRELTSSLSGALQRLYLEDELHVKQKNRDFTVQTMQDASVKLQNFIDATYRTDDYKRLVRELDDVIYPRILLLSDTAIKTFDALTDCVALSGSISAFRDAGQDLLMFWHIQILTLESRRDTITNVVPLVRNFMDAFQYASLNSSWAEIEFKPEVLNPVVDSLFTDFKECSVAYIDFCHENGYHVVSMENEAIVQFLDEFISLLYSYSLSLGELIKQEHQLDDSTMELKKRFDASIRKELETTQ